MIKKLSLLVLCIAVVPKSVIAMELGGKKLILGAAAGAAAWFTVRYVYEKLYANQVVTTARALPTIDDALQGARNELAKNPEALHQACKKGNFLKAQLLLTAGASVDAKDKDDFVPLHEAAVSGYKDIVELLLDHGADVNASMGNGWTPLHFAAYYGDSSNHAAVVKLLLCRGASVDAPTKTGFVDDFDRDDTHLYPSSITRWRDANGWTSLHLAAYKEHDTIVKILLSHNASANALDAYGWTPLHVAALLDNTKSALLLLSHGAHVDVQTTKGFIDDRDHKSWAGRSRVIIGWTPLHLAVYKNHNDTARLLLTYNASINLQDNGGMTPLDSAFRYSNTIIIKHMLKKGFLVPDGQSVANFDPCSLTQRCLKSILVNFDKYEEEDLINEAVPHLGHYSDYYDLIADAMPLKLQQAMVKSQTVDQQKKLLGVHCQRHLKGMQNVIRTKSNAILARTQHASNKALADLINDIIQARTFSNLSQKLQTSIKVTIKNRLLMSDETIADIQRIAINAQFHKAALKGAVARIEDLLKQGAAIDAPDVKGFTALQKAATQYISYTGKKAFEYLASNGASLNTQNKHSRMLLHYAAYLGDIELVKNLVDYGANLDIQDSAGLTPLHEAARHSCVEIIDYLLSHGASMDKQDGNGWKPLDLARQENNPEAVSLLTSSDSHGTYNNDMTIICSCPRRMHASIPLEHLITKQFNR